MLKTISIALIAALAGSVSAHAECDGITLPVALAETGYTAEAVSIGTDCASAVGIMILRNADGLPVYTFAAPAGQVFELQWAENLEDMRTALDEWVGGGTVMTSAELPEWPTGQDFPMGEFGFLPEDWMDQPGYEAMRKEKSPVWCHTQGLESTACLALADGYIEQIGIERFPG